MSLSSMEQKAASLWYGDGSTNLDFAGSISSLGNVKNVSPGQEMHSAGFIAAGFVPKGTSAWRFMLTFDTSRAEQQGWSVGLSTPGRIKPGYHVRGYFMNDRNLHDGVRLLQADYGSDCAQSKTSTKRIGSVVDLQVEWNEDPNNFEMYFIQDDVPLGPAYRFAADTVPVDLVPTVVLGGGGQRAAIQKISDHRLPADLTRTGSCSIDPIEGSWMFSEWPPTFNSALASTDVVLKITAVPADEEYLIARYKLAFSVVNRFFGGLECERHASGAPGLFACKPSQFGGTKMALSPPMDEAESQVVGFFSTLQNLKLSTGNTVGGPAIVLETKDGDFAVASREQPDLFKVVTENPLAPNS